MPDRSRLQTAKEATDLVMVWTFFIWLIFWMFKPGPDGELW
jgi:hypothetical protein